MGTRVKKQLSYALLSWFSAEKRNLPWRINRNWYRVWISEVMLQQTQVKQVIPYYNRFLKDFPTVQKLAQATQQEVLKAWEGLGYYARARNLHKAAQHIVNEYHSEIPRDKKNLTKLPGFGPYTSHALLSLAFNQPYAVVDGNVMRVIARLFAIEQDIRDPMTKKEIQFHMDSLLDKKSSALFNEAMMELGATICTPVYPTCKRCPLNSYCMAFRKNQVQHYPIKSVIRKKPHIYAFTYILMKNNKLLLVKRPQSGLLAGLWEFPCYFFNNGQSESRMDFSKVLKKMGFSGKHIKTWPKVRHSYTHFHLHIEPHYFHISENRNSLEHYDDSTWLDVSAIELLPIHRAMQKVINLIDADLKIITQ